MRAAPLADADVALAQFGPGDLERITGFPQHLQRLWRRRGHLEEKTPHARSHFSSLEVAELFVRYQLAIYCVSPVRSRAIGEKAGPMVLFAALLNADGACEAIGDGQRVEAFIHAFGEDYALASHLAGEHDSYSQFLWSSGGSDFSFAPDCGPVIASGSRHSYVFLDLQAMAETLAQRAGKPLVTVTFPSEPGTRVSRRLTTGSSGQK